jgi:hypothetical protein
MHILVVEVAVVSLQLLLTAVTFTKCHTLTCSHCNEFWCHVLVVTSSSAARTRESRANNQKLTQHLHSQWCNGGMQWDGIPQIIWKGNGIPK